MILFKRKNLKINLLNIIINMNNYIESIFNYVFEFLEWSSDLYRTRQQNIFGITPDEDILGDCWSS